MQYVQGTIGKIFENTTQKGNTYWAVMIDRQRYSLFDAEIRKQLDEDRPVHIGYETDGKYLTIKELVNGQGGSQQQGPQQECQQHKAQAPQPKYEVPWEESQRKPNGHQAGLTSRDESIIRQCCIKAAVDLLKGYSSDSPESVADDALLIAERFSAWCRGKPAYELIQSGPKHPDDDIPF